MEWTEDLAKTSDEIEKQHNELFKRVMPLLKAWEMSE